MTAAVAVAVLALAIVLVMPLAAAESFQVGTCAAASEYFDTPSISCKQCHVGAVADASRVPDTSSLDVLGYAPKCVCPEGYRTSDIACDVTSPTVCGPPECASCIASGQAVSRDHTRCMPCGSTTNGLDVALGDCTCPANHALVETTVTGVALASKECEPCPATHRVFSTASAGFLADRYTCQTCPDPNQEFDASNTCQCKTGYTATGVAALSGIKCIADARMTALNVYSETRVTFLDVLTSTGVTTTATVDPSLTFKDLYIPAAAECFNWLDEASNEACQTLANMCVLRMYDRSAKPCELLVQVVAKSRGASVHGWAGWANTLPMLYYFLDRSASASTVTDTLDLSATMSFDEAQFPDTHEWMQFKLVRFSLDGKLLGISDLANQFVYCDNTAAASPGRPKFLKYGVSASATNGCDLSTLLDAGPTEFLDLYVVDYSKTGSLTVDPTTGLPTYLYPVPVRVINYREGTTQPNINENSADEDNDELVRRFFLYDNVGALHTVGESPSYIRFAQKITLTIPTQTEETARIRPPVLTIVYSERSVASFAQDSTLQHTDLEFIVQYTTDLQSFWTAAVVLLALCMVVVVLSCCLRIFNWCGRNTRSRAEQVLTLGVLVRAGVYFAGNFGRVIFWLVVGLCGYWVMFFKLQDSAFTMLPAVNTNLAGNDYETFDAMIILCWVGMLVRIVEIVWTQSQVDIFFVDWERDKGEAVHTREDDVLDDVEAKGGRKHRRVKYPQVSAWRSILAANEFSEMQTVRKTSLNFTLLILLFFLRGVGLEYVATPQPTVTDLTPGETNPVLLFGLVSLLWLGINLVQVVWNVAVYERWFSEPATSRFIDLCTLAKISMLALMDKYHGYYLHCRSSHTHADANMAQLTNQLQQDTHKDKEIARGLENCPDGEDLQMFELFVTENWRQHYDRVLGKLQKSRRDNRDPLESNGIFSLCMETKRTKEDTKALLKTTALLLDFFKGFIDETDPNFPRRWMHRVWYFRILNIPPEFVEGSVAVGDSTRVYGDPNARWESILFRGVELDLMMFNILTFAVGYLIFENTVVCTIWVFLAEAVLSYCRWTLGMRNIANKALVDERFLK